MTLASHRLSSAGTSVHAAYRRVLICLPDLWDRESPQQLVWHLPEKLDNKAYRVYTLLGDGEIQEGQVWEASMFAGHRKLDNLVVIVDNNGLQIDGNIADVCSPYPIDKKFEAFNFHVINVADGNDMDAAAQPHLRKQETTKGMPTAIIMKTVKGKGVSFMENQASWHGVAPNDEQYAVAMADLEKVGEALCQK